VPDLLTDGEEMSAEVRFRVDVGSLFVIGRADFADGRLSAQRIRVQLELGAPDDSAGNLGSIGQLRERAVRMPLRLGPFTSPGPSAPKYVA
jgi:hypothetical protein